jgi:hypothetical protein
MTMSNQQVIYKEATMSSIKKDLNIALPSDQAYQFLVDTINNASTLPKLQPIFRKDSAGNIDTISVKSRKIKLHSKNHTPTGVDGTDNGQIPYNVKKVFWDEWLQDDDVWYNLQARNENVEQTVIAMIQKQFGVDLQDLIFNGDTATLEANPDYAFLSVLDGFVKKMKTSTYKTDLAAAEPTLLDFVNHVRVLPEKYKNAHDDITWLINRNTHDKLMSQATQRLTGFGDAVLLDGKLTRLGGYNIEVVSNLQSGFAALTPLKNIKPVFTRELRYNRTGVGATATAKDATYHIIFAYLDAVVREIDAVAWMTGTKI